MLSASEKDTYSRFVGAIRDGFVPVEESTINDDVIVGWVRETTLLFLM